MLFVTCDNISTYIRIKNKDFYLKNFRVKFSIVCSPEKLWIVDSPISQ